MSATMEMHRFKKMSLGNISYLHDVHAFFSYSLTRWPQSHLTTRKAVSLSLYAQMDSSLFNILLRVIKSFGFYSSAHLEVHLSVLYGFCFGRKVFFIWLTIPILLYLVFLSPWCVLVICFFAHT